MAFTLSLDTFLGEGKRNSQTSLNSARSDAERQEERGKQDEYDRKVGLMWSCHVQGSCQPLLCLISFGCMNRYLSLSYRELSCHFAVTAIRSFTWIIVFLLSVVDVVSVVSVVSVVDVIADVVIVDVVIVDDVVDVVHVV